MRALGYGLLVFLVSGGAVCSARADESAGEYPAPCEASKVSKAEADRAHAVFVSGRQFLEESNYDKAIGYFKDAYGIDCSRHAILPILATTYERKGDKPAAIRALREYLRRQPSAPDREVIERRIGNLTDQIAREAPPPVPPPVPTASVDGGPAPLPLTEPVTPAPPDVVRHTSSPLPWIVTGVGGAAIPVGIVLVVAGANQVSAAERDCPLRTSCSPDVATKGNNGRTIEGTGVVLLAAGPLAVAGGLLWYFLSRESKTAGFVPSLVVGSGCAQAGVAGSF